MKDEITTILFDHLAYDSLEISLEKFKNIKKIKIQLQPNEIMLGEVVIDGNTHNLGKQLVDSAYKHLNENLITTQYLSDAHFQTRRLENGQYVFYAESNVSFGQPEPTNLSYKEIGAKFNCEIQVFDSPYGAKPHILPVLLPAPKKKAVKYDPQYWATQPLPNDWAKIKRDLEEFHGETIEQQFSSNSEYLIGKSKYMKMMKLCPRKDRRDMVELLKIYNKNTLFND